jgi:hypothetical protein
MFAQLLNVLIVHFPPAIVQLLSIWENGYYLTRTTVVSYYYYLTGPVINTKVDKFGGTGI